jgi:predicted AlkP superfamily pyrophosphatase or phosphodiesterase
MRRSSSFSIVRFYRGLATILMFLSAPALGPADLFAARGGGEIPPPTAETEHVILFVLEGIGQDSLKGGAMPVLSKLISDGSVTWSATSVKPALRLPLMASIITGVPADRHGITWNTFEFSRGYPRAPTVFDYLDLSG